MRKCMIISVVIETTSFSMNSTTWLFEIKNTLGSYEIPAYLSLMTVRVQTSPIFRCHDLSSYDFIFPSILTHY